MITYPLNNIDYTAEDAELYFSTRESGVYDGNDFEVTAFGIDNDVIVGTGIAWIHNTKFSGKVVALKEPKTLTLSLPNSVYDRIDAIVIQFDANKNATEIIVKEGISSSSPIAPNVVRTESLYELHIFHIRRKAGATVISVDDLVDLRNNSDYCGIMFDPISSIDSTFTKSGYAADAKATGKAIKRATNVRNLLDNSDFTNPVNQRGYTSGTDVVAYARFIDRWKNFDEEGGTFSLTSNGLVCGKQIAQYVDSTKLIEKTLTYAIKWADGLILTVTRTIVNSSSWNESIKREDGGTRFISLIEGGESNRLYCYISASPIAVEWAALYEGEYTAETLPPYVPKGYAMELAECQRYYRYFGNITLPCMPIIDATALDIDSTFANGMRTKNPTILGTITAVYGGGGYMESGFPGYTFGWWSNHIRVSFSSKLSQVKNLMGSSVYIDGFALSADL